MKKIKIQSQIKIKIQIQIKNIKKKLVKQSKIMYPKLFYSSTVKKKKLHINYNMLLVDTLLLEGTSIPVVKSQKKFLIVHYIVNVDLVILYYYLFVLIKK